MKVAYVAMPYRAPTAYETHHNIERARQLAEELWQEGYAVVCPHLNTAHMDGLVSEGDFLDGCLAIVRRVDVVVMGPGWEKSEGARAEESESLRNGIKIEYREGVDCE